MGEVDNFINDSVIGKTIRDINDGNSTALVIPKELARELQIENSKVSMSVVYDCEGTKNLLISKYHREIVID